MGIMDPASGNRFFSKRRRRIGDEKSPRKLTFTCTAPKDWEWFSARW